MARTDAVPKEHTMRSIQSKFVTLSVIAILLCIGVVGGFGIWSMARAQEDSSNQLLSHICLNNARNFDIELVSIQGAVDACADIVEGQFESPSELSDPQKLERHLSEAERLVGDVAKHVVGVCTYYLRFDPALSNDFAGFFYTKKGREVSLTKETLTDITAFDPSDTEHVGWYFEPRDAGTPLWMEPYYNQNIDVYMVSYVVPMYLNNTFIGVVGMDINFNVIINLMRHIEGYETGRAFLVSEDGTIYYHPTLKIGTTLVEAAPELHSIVDELPSLEKGQSSHVATYTLDGVQRKLVGCGLNNGMYLMISVDSAEIAAPVFELARTDTLAGLAICAIVVSVVFVMSRRIARPLVELADVAHEVSEGNLDVTVPQAGNDEVGVLARSLEVTIASLKSYIASVHDKAYTDPLTKVRNKTSYAIDAQSLQDEMSSGMREFALVMLDLNDLKLVNDRYGHDRGDEYLQEGCQLICRVFSHSPVYRIGGDEFVVILRRGDYVRRELLMDTFGKRMEETQKSQEPWRRISIARGMSCCTQSDAVVEEVFRRADEAMYADKRRMKGDALR